MTVGRFSLIVFLAVAVAAGTATAATLNVPVPYATIGDAIAAANPNDTIVVGDGDYPENIVIDVEGSALISVNGPGATSISGVAVDTPVITIDADRVTVGTANRGFAIVQEAGGATDYVILVNGAEVGPATVRIRNNIIEADQAEVGIFVDPNIEGGHLVVQENTFRASAGAAGPAFETAISFKGGDYSATPISDMVSAHTATIDLLSNYIRDFDSVGIYFNDMVHASDISIDSCRLTGTAAATEGIYFNSEISVFSVVDIRDTTIEDVEDGVQADYVDAQSSLSIVDTDIIDFTGDGVYIAQRVKGLSTFRIEGCTLRGDGADNGVRVSDYVETDSTGTIADNTISGFDNRGIKANTQDGGLVSITDNVLTGNKAKYGIYTNVESAIFQATGNTISGFGDNGDTAYGIYVSDCDYGSMMVIDDNKVTALSSVNNTYGIYCSTGPNYGSFGYINNNTVNSFNYAGIYADDCYYGSYLELTGNVVTGQTAGAEYGFYLDDTYDGSEMLVHDNTASSFTYCGLYIYDTYASELEVTDNTLTAHKDGSEYGIYTYDIYENATATITGNKVSGFGNIAKRTDEYGFYNDEVDDGSRLYFARNTFTAHANGADYGFYTSAGLDYAGEGVIEDNQFTGFTYAGFYNDEYIEYGSHLALKGNTFTAHKDGADYGIWAVDDGPYEGSSLTVTDNIVSGFTDTGLAVDETEEGCELTVTDNVFTAHKDGADYGIECDDIEYNSTAVISGNRIEGIKDDGGDSYGIFFNDMYDGSTLELCDNIVLPHADGASYGIWFNYPPNAGGFMTVCNNNVSEFSDTQVFFDNADLDAGILDIYGNNLKGGQYGIRFRGEIGDGSNLSIALNIVHQFDTVGIYFENVVWGCDARIHYNRIFGGGTDAGIEFASSINSAATVDIMGNCFDTVPEAVRVEMVEDTAVVTINQNDFEGATSDGVRNVNGDADHTIDAEDNWWGAPSVLTAATMVGGFVDYDPVLAGPPDIDGDGLSVCDDFCPDTALGDAVDANGCSCLQLNPDGDVDGDGVPDCLDNCPTIPNAGQLDSNGDGFGDACQAVPVPAIPAAQPAPCGFCGSSGAAMYSLMGLTYCLVLLMRRRRA